jgi:nitroreductase
VDALEAISTARSMRWLKPDPVDDKLVAQVLYAATCAPSPHNCQPWRFVVVRDPDTRKRYGQAVAAGAQSSGLAARISEHDHDPRRVKGVEHLAASLGEAPVIIVACGVNIFPPREPDDYFMYTSVHTACQNLVVAARALGLGASFTMLNRLAEPELRQIIGLPDDHALIATIPLGWPDRPFGKVARLPVAEVTRYDRWQQAI